MTQVVYYDLSSFQVQIFLIESNSISNRLRSIIGNPLFHIYSRNELGHRSQDIFTSYLEYRNDRDDFIRQWLK